MTFWGPRFSDEKSNSRHLVGKYILGILTQTGLETCRSKDATEAIAANVEALSTEFRSATKQLCINTSKLASKRVATTLWDRTQQEAATKANSSI